MFPPKAVGKYLPLPLPMVTSNPWPWHSWACCCVTPIAASAAHDPLPSGSGCFKSFSPFKDTGHWI